MGVMGRKADTRCVTICGAQGLRALPVEEISAYSFPLCELCTLCVRRFRMHHARSSDSLESAGRVECHDEAMDIGPAERRSALQKKSK